MILFESKRLTGEKLKSEVLIYTFGPKADKCNTKASAVRITECSCGPTVFTELTAHSVRTFTSTCQQDAGARARPFSGNTLGQ